MKVKFENIRIDKIDNGYVVELSYNKIKESGMEWDTLSRYCVDIQAVLEFIKDTLTLYNK